MDLKISLDENFKICYLCYENKKRCYDSCPLEVGTRLTIVKGKDKALVIQEPNKNSNRYWFEDFDYLVFLEQTSQSEYKIDLFEDDCVDVITQYLDWRKVNYEVRNS